MKKNENRLSNFQTVASLLLTLDHDGSNPDYDGSNPDQDGPILTMMVKPRP